MGLRRALIAAVVGLAALPASAAAADCTKTWDGPATGANWNTAANWAPDGIPGADDVVCVGAGTSTALAANVTVRAVRVDGTLTHSYSYALTLTDTAEPSSIATYVKQGLVDTAGTLDIADMTWQGGSISGAGTTTFSGTYAVLGNVNFPSVGAGHTLVTAGDGSFTSYGLGLGDGARWINRGAATGQGGSFSGGTFHNEPGASLTKTAGTGSWSLGMPTDNDGTITRVDDASLGRVYVSGDDGLESNGTFTGVSLSGTHRLGPDAVLNQVYNSADVRLTPGATYTLTDFTSGGGTIAGRDATIVLAGDSWAYYGRIGDDNTLDPEGQAARIVVPEGSSLLWTAAMGFYARRFITAGEVRIEETGLGRPLETLGSRMVWENTGTIEVLAGLLPMNDEGQRLVNRGTILKTGTGNLSVQIKLVNDGLVDIQRGRITASRFEQTADGILRFGLGGTSAASQHGVLTATVFRYSGRLEATLDAGYVPAAGARHSVIASTRTARSGEFLSQALSGLFLEEVGTSALAVTAPAAAVAAPFAAAATTTAASLAAPASTEPAAQQSVAKHHAAAQRAAAKSLAAQRAAAERAVAKARRAAAELAARR